MAHGRLGRGGRRGEGHAADGGDGHESSEGSHHPAMVAAAKRAVKPLKRRPEFNRQDAKTPRKQRDDFFFAFLRLGVLASWRLALFLEPGLQSRRLKGSAFLVPGGFGVGGAAGGGGGVAFAGALAPVAFDDEPCVASGGLGKGEALADAVLGGGAAALEVWEARRSPVASA